MQKIKILVIAGLIGLVAGYALNPLTPIIKRICTSSFVIVSGGWSVLARAFSYWLIYIKKTQKWVVFFTVVGMNPLFIYLFAHVGGGRFIYTIIKPFSMALFGWTGELSAQIISCTIVWFLLWYICYWFYKKRIFIKIWQGRLHLVCFSYHFARFYSNFGISLQNKFPETNTLSTLNH